MGIIKAAINSIGGELSDAYLEAYRPSRMTQRTVVAPGIFADAGQGRNTNTKRMNNVISNGSMIQVASGQLMCLVDGGRVVDYTTVPGYYKVSNSSSPSLMNGEFGATLKDGWERIKFGGNTYHEQRVIYINLRPMEGIKFGTKSPVPYYDEFYKIDVMVRAFGTFSLQIVEPWKFFNTVLPPECVTDGVGLEVDDFLDWCHDAHHQRGSCQAPEGKLHPVFLKGAHLAQANVALAAHPDGEHIHVGMGGKGT